MQRFVSSSDLKKLIKLFFIFVIFTIALQNVELFYNRTFRMQVADTTKMELQYSSSDMPKDLRNSSSGVVLHKAGEHFVMGPESHILQ